MSSSSQVLVVGGGPGGAAAAFWLARNGINVTLVEKKRYPREKACGDGLTPRAVRQLVDMGFDFDRPEVHRVVGRRSDAGDVMPPKSTWFEPKLRSGMIVNLLTE